MTADDFGRSAEINAAVIAAHQRGILTCASLMVSGEAVDEAVALATENPGLRVGLHLVLIDGISVLPKTEIPELVDENRRFSSDPAAGGARYFFSACARRQLGKESRAQVEKFRSFGLEMDHLNSHHHLHIHPTVAGIVAELAKEFDIPAIRLPLQGLRTLTPSTAAMAAVMFPWIINLKVKLARSGIAHNREVFGLYENDAMHEDTWLRLIPKLKSGVTEIFCHPAVAARDNLVQRHPSTGEFEALVSPKVKALLRNENVTLGCFSDLR
ncbi:hypothetical protein D3OALGA1CA_958 [Olavius algarvensis associated proteobacterium Delta 3]|nr:hypothetical protein D3OALGA1CA_958 [Olavius algarvensis associated proteobacterium Delta 3]CAB5129829.1 hypothetical protein D3OALGB2SA_3545 [Olavius algarvensis associated proteobacterium Delta 3]